jgi:hypothetical protein
LAFGHPLTFAELLDRLQHRCNCSVVRQDEGLIPDAYTGGASGELYYVERFKDGELRYAFVEVFHPNVAVLPDRLQTICNELGLDPSDLMNRPH